MDMLLKEVDGLRAVFLDFKAAYDMVDRRILWQDLVMMGVNDRIIENLRVLFDRNHARINIHGHKSDKIKCDRGLLQGSAISPMLFNVFINSLIKELKQGACVKLREFQSNNLFFADDGVIFANSDVGMQTLLDVCSNWADRRGMRFAPSKCAALANTTFTIQNGPIPIVDDFTYLGIEISKQGVEFK
jgi:hypothetical protein